jgi:hypothetical protein
MPRYQLNPPPASRAVIQELKEAAEQIAAGGTVYQRQLSPAEAYVLTDLLIYLESIAWVISTHGIELRMMDEPRQAVILPIPLDDDADLTKH